MLNPLMPKGVEHIEYVEPHSNYRCTCPLPRDDDHEIELALACWERQLEHDRAHGAAPGAPTTASEERER